MVSVRCAETVCSLVFLAAPLSACRAAAALAAKRKYAQGLPSPGMTTGCSTPCRCLPAELLLRRPWFIGTSDLDVLSKVFAALGTPTEAQWPDMRALPNFVEYSRTEAPPLGSIIKGVSLFLLGLWRRLGSFATHLSTVRLRGTWGLALMKTFWAAQNNVCGSMGDTSAKLVADGHQL